MTCASAAPDVGGRLVMLGGVIGYATVATERSLCPLAEATAFSVIIVVAPAGHGERIGRPGRVRLRLLRERIGFKSDR